MIHPQTYFPSLIGGYCSTKILMSSHPCTTLIASRRITRMHFRLISLDLALSAMITTRIRSGCIPCSHMGSSSGHVDIAAESIRRTLKSAWPSGCINTVTSPKSLPCSLPTWIQLRLSILICSVGAPVPLLAHRRSLTLLRFIPTSLPKQAPSLAPNLPSTL